ncbi:MAG: bifunctional phosphopantothenoylcysteine decarboxylase/phosphopantothenate--cysteine ligase CoaBC [Proteobacteria bacterium]|nr:bifunctional phosphopantothenoylcysteine decarboxylase/phosphopantothenate--cysteine ligase CoaBC [Pseudomonadota bacterium]
MNITQWILGISGGIAAYKTPELVRLLKKQDCEVKVVLSQGAKAFVTPLTLQAVAGGAVYSEMMDPDFEAAMGHIELARWAQGILIAPISANRMAALAHGMADDLLTTLCLATTAPIWIAPAMNQQMWHHPATQANLEILKARGVNILGPDWGEQACKEVGLGRMLEPQAILALLQSQEMLFKDCRILISAGPTREAIDPIRYISNHSSGKMGFALAKAAQSMGAKVTLISGPVTLPTPLGVHCIRVTTAQEMFEAVMQESNCDIFISAAAVSDFHVENIALQKIKKQGAATLALNLVATQDILANVARLPNRPFCVGFAAETQNWQENARRKLNEKEIDLIAVNDVSRDDIGFNKEDNALTVLSQEKTVNLSKKSKYQIAQELLQIISEHYHAKNTIKNT